MAEWNILFQLEADFDYQNQMKLKVGFEGKKDLLN